MEIEYHVKKQAKPEGQMFRVNLKLIKNEKHQKCIKHHACCTIYNNSKSPTKEA